MLVYDPAVNTTITILMITMYSKATEPMVNLTSKRESKYQHLLCCPQPSQPMHYEHTQPPFGNL